MTSTSKLNGQCCMAMTMKKLEPNLDGSDYVFEKLLKGDDTLKINGRG